MSIVYYYTILDGELFRESVFLVLCRLLNLLQQPVASNKSVIEKQQEQQHQRVAANESASGSAAGGKWDSCHLGDSLFASLMPFGRLQTYVCMYVCITQMNLCATRLAEKPNWAN